MFESLFPLLECKLTRGGQEYKGTKAVTISGKPCQSWLQSYPHITDVLPDATIDDAENFCRNPGETHPYGPWCFTSLDSVREWDYCNVPYCDDAQINTSKRACTQCCGKRINQINGCWHFMLYILCSL